MKIVVNRFRYWQNCVTSSVFIDGEHICDAVENAFSAIPNGNYTVALTKCKQHARKMPVIEMQNNGLCAKCPKQTCTDFNTTLPQLCYMLKPGNGVNKRADGSIIVGTTIVPGCLSHPKQAFDALYERIRKNLERGNSVDIIFSSSNNIVL